MKDEFDIICSSCGVNEPVSRFYHLALQYRKGSLNIHSRIVLFCGRCGASHEMVVAEPLSPPVDIHKEADEDPTEWRTLLMRLTDNEAKAIKYD